MRANAWAEPHNYIEAGSSHKTKHNTGRPVKSRASRFNVDVETGQFLAASRLLIKISTRQLFIHIFIQVLYIPRRCPDEKVGLIIIQRSLSLQLILKKKPMGRTAICHRVLIG